MYDATALCLRCRADPPSHVTRRHRHEREHDGPEYGVAPQCLLCGLASSASSHTGATAAPASRRSVSTEGTNTRPQIRHHSNRALLGAMARECTLRGWLSCAGPQLPQHTQLSRGAVATRMQSPLSEVAPPRGRWTGACIVQVPVHPPALRSATDMTSPRDSVVGRSQGASRLGDTL